MQLGVAFDLSSGQWNMGRNDVYHFQASSMKSPIKSSSLPSSAGRMDAEESLKSYKAKRKKSGALRWQGRTEPWLLIDLNKINLYSDKPLRFWSALVIAASLPWVQQLVTPLIQVDMFLLTESTN